MDAYTVAKEYFKDLEGFEVTEIMNGGAIDIVLRKNGVVASRAVSKFTLNRLPHDIIMYLDILTEDLTKELNAFIRRVN